MDFYIFNFFFATSVQHCSLFHCFAVFHTVYRYYSFLLRTTDFRRFVHIYSNNLNRKLLFFWQWHRRYRTWEWIEVNGIIILIWIKKPWKESGYFTMWMVKQLSKFENFRKEPFLNVIKYILKCHFSGICRMSLFFLYRRSSRLQKWFSWIHETF